MLQTGPLVRRVSFAFVFVLSMISGFCQTLTITDQSTSEPLEFVTISSNNPKLFVTTNTKGKADIGSFKDADLIEIRFIGYQTIRTTYQNILIDEFSIQMKPSDISLDQVVVSATRWNQSTMDIPTKVTSIQPKDIALFNPQTAADLLGNTGQVFIQKSQQGGGSPMIRGFSTNRLLYTVDGVRMNTAIFRSGNLQNVISLDPFAMENAEVLFGPGSIIYGSDAIGGVMAFTTLTPQFSSGTTPLFNGKSTIRYSTANQEKTGHVDLNIGWKNWASVSSISFNSYGDLTMGRYGPDEYLRDSYVTRINNTDSIISNNEPRKQTHTGYDQINLMQKVRFKPNDHWDAQIGIHYSSTTSYSRYDRLIQTRNNQPSFGQWDYGPQVWMMNNFTLVNRRNNKLYNEASLRLTHQRFEESRISRGYKEDIRSTNTEKVDAFSANLDLNKSLLNNTKLFYGIDLVTNLVESDGFETDINTGVASDGPSRYPDANWSSYAVYLSVQQQLSNKMILQLGTRYNQFIINSDFSENLAYYPFEDSEININDGALTGSLGLVYHPKPTWSISMNASTAFRAPNVDDIGKVFDSEPGAVVVPNPNLDAEYAYNIEGGISKVIEEWVKIDLTTYFTYLNNAMVRRDFTINGQDSIMYDGILSKVQAIQNAANSRVYGVQVGVETKLGRGFGLSSQFNYQKGEEELDNGNVSPSRHAAPWFGLTRLTYKHQNLNVQLTGQYSGEVPFSRMPEEEKGKPHIYATDGNGNPYSPGWYTININAMYQLTDVFSMSAGIENISDQRYRPYSSGLVAPGRNFILSASAKF